MILNKFRVNGDIKCLADEWYNKSKDILFTKVEETKDAYVYKLTFHPTPSEYNPTYSVYEVFKKKLRKKLKQEEGDFEYAEKYPSDESFGYWAWSCTTIEHCHKVMRENGILGG